MAYADRTSYYRARYDAGGDFVPRERLDGEIADHARRLSSVLEALRALPFADRIVVFGSVSSGAFLPGDLDVSVDLASGKAGDVAGIAGSLLSLASRHYGYLDTFLVDARGGLHVRNENANGWERARNAKGIKAGIKAGVRLPDLSWSLDGAPGVYDPLAWKLEDARRHWDELPTLGYASEALERLKAFHLESLGRHPLADVRALGESLSSEPPASSPRP